MNLSQTLVSLLLLGSTTSFAGNVRGNGGGVVVCRDSQGKILTAEILDFYEARELRHMQHDFGPATSTYMEKVKYVLQRRRDVAPVRAMMWGQWADSFEAEATRLTNVELELINDSLIQAWPRGCKIEQIVIQHVPTFPEDRRYVVNQDLWLALDEENKAGLILHEIIYREAIIYGHEDSVATRYVNSVWSSVGTPSYLASQAALNDFLKMVKFPVGEWQGTAPSLYECSYDPEKNSARFNLKRPRELFYPTSIYPSFFQSETIELHLAYSQFKVHLKEDAEYVCNSQSAGSTNQDATLYRLNVGYGEALIQNQLLKFSILDYSSVNYPGRLLIRTPSSFHKLEGVNGKLYSSLKDATLWFDEHLKVADCHDCIEE